MSAKTDFFSNKRDWSKLKDQILDQYLAPYLAKVTSNRRPTRIADCFAGKGRFDDGSKGSPLIIAKHVAFQRNRTPARDTKAVFIEKKYAIELQTNLADTPGCEVISGEYEQCLDNFLSQAVDRERNYFFYVDPYGIKSLDFNIFARLKAANFRTLEILINVNSTGFLREGCRLLKLTREIPDWAKDLDFEVDGKSTPERMNAIAGGDYWQDILGEFQSETITFHQAEDRFISEYADRLNQIFSFVIHVPIRERSHRLPKYRLVFATDHFDGLFLMASEMHKAWRNKLDSERGGPLYLFDSTQLAELSAPPVHEKVRDELDQPLELSNLLAMLIKRHGILHAPSEYTNAIKAREGTMFNVERDPPTTSAGRISKSMDYNKYKITVANITIENSLLNLFS